MYREKIEDLKKWKDKSNRKPLMVNGARQVGKSWLIRHFGNTCMEGKLIEINLEKSRELHIVFQKNFDIQRIILELELYLNIQIETGKDLLFLDEIQACSEALGSLRYFYEDLPELHVIAAGSLLDFEFRNQPYPIGRIEVMNMYPMSFYEFLMARNKVNLVKLLDSDLKSIPEDVNPFFEEDFHLYLIIGGMPECVKYFIDTSDLVGIASIQDNLIYSLQQDFKKYKPTVDANCLMDVIENSIKNVGNQTIYSKLSDRFTNPTIKKSVELLKTARVLHEVKNVSVSSLPLTATGKQFKLYFIDIGLLLRISRLDYKSLFIKKELGAAFQGILAEQFVAQQLFLKYNQDVFYWARTESGANAEVDFVLINENKILPVEVKAGKGGSLKSLHYLLRHNPHIPRAYVFSLSQQGVDNGINYIPLYWAGRI